MGNQNKGREQKQADCNKLYYFKIDITIYDKTISGILFLIEIKKNKM